MGVGGLQTEGGGGVGRASQVLSLQNKKGVGGRGGGGVRAVQKGCVC